jgi:hypothetical protein
MGLLTYGNLLLWKTVNSKPEWKVNELPLMGFDSATFGTPTNRSQPSPTLNM